MFHAPADRRGASLFSRAKRCEKQARGVCACTSDPLERERERESQTLILFSSSIGWQASQFHTHVPAAIQFLLAKPNISYSFVGVGSPGIKRARSRFASKRKKVSAVNWPRGARLRLACSRVKLNWPLLYTKKLNSNGHIHTHTQTKTEEETEESALEKRAHQNGLLLLFLVCPFGGANVCAASAQQKLENFLPPFQKESRARVASRRARLTRASVRAC